MSRQRETDLSALLAYLWNGDKNNDLYFYIQKRWSNKNQIYPFTQNSQKQ